MGAQLKQVIEVGLIEPTPSAVWQAAPHLIPKSV